MTRFPTKKQFARWMTRQNSRKFTRGTLRNCPIAGYLKNHGANKYYVWVQEGQYGRDSSNRVYQLPQWARQFVYIYDMFGWKDAEKFITGKKTFEQILYHNTKFI